MLIQLIYVQNQKYLIDFDVQQVTKRKIFIIFNEEFYNYIHFNLARSLRRDKDEVILLFIALVSLYAMNSWSKKLVLDIGWTKNI
jgi:hypothetical protein